MYTQISQINLVTKKYLLEITWLYYKYLKILFRGNWEGPGFIRNALHFGMKWNYSGWIWFYAWKNWLKLIFVFFDRSTSVNKQNYLYRGPRILWFWISCSWTGLEKVELEHPWWGYKFQFLQIFWVLRVYGIGVFMPISSVFILLMLRALYRMM